MINKLSLLLFSMLRYTLFYRRFSIAVSILFLSCCCTRIYSQQLINSSSSDQVRLETTESKIESILSLMTLKEKVSMCHAQSQFSSPGIPRLGIPELWMSDGPHGIRAEINWSNWDYSGWTNDYITAFPALTCLSATFNPDLSNQYGTSIGEEARYRKKDVPRKLASYACLGDVSLFIGDPISISRPLRAASLVLCVPPQSEITTPSKLQSVLRILFKRSL